MFNENSLDETTGGNVIKVVTAKEMARIEKLAYADGFSEEAFMNKAGEGVAELVQRCIAQGHLKPHILLLCGSGNNAGDVYVAGAILREGGFHVHALSCAPYEKSSPLCQLQSRRFVKSGGIIEYIQKKEEIDFDEATILVDGLLGTGFHGKVEGLFHEMITLANASRLPIVAVDIPSGINGTTGERQGAAIKACDTLFLGLPKTGCFFDEAWNYVGRVHVFNFGLEAKYIADAKEDFFLINDDLIKELFPPIIRTRHKYQAGYVVGVGGAPGMPGAPIMSSFAALRAGAGIVRLLYPEGMESELAFAPYEVIRQAYQDAETILEAMERASSLFIGPGLGTSPEAVKMLKKVLPAINKPCVIDAEALTILAHHPIKLPPKTILTPQAGEMNRLLGLEKTPPKAELVSRCQHFCEEKNVTLVLKGAPTFIFHPKQKPYISSRGDPGMATAGSGDVLTGVIAAFLAQVGDPLTASILGVYVHGVAGEHACKKWTSYCLAATDITAALPLAFAEFQ